MRWLLGLLAGLGVVIPVSTLTGQDVVLSDVEWVSEEDAPEVLPVASRRIDPPLPEQIRKLAQPAYAETQILIGPDGKIALVQHVQSTPWLKGEEPLLNGFSPARRNGKGVWSQVRYFAIFNPASAGTKGAEASPRLLKVVPPRLPVKNDAAVTMRVEVDESGRVTAATRLEGDPVHAHAAERAVRRWIFAPARRDGRPVAGSVEVPVLFKSALPSGEEGLDEPPRPLKMERPVYPYGLRQAGMTGEVVIGCEISVEGRIRSAEVVLSSHPGFDEAALDALLKWTFRPGMKDGRPVEARMQIPVHFRIAGSDGASSYKINTSKKIQASLPPRFRFDHPPQVRGAVLGVYPLTALDENQGGTVKVNVAIDEAGHVVATQVVGSPRQDLGRAAQAMIECFEFTPAARDGKPTPTLLTFEIRFSPNGAGDIPVSSSADRLLRRRKKADLAFPSVQDLDGPVEALSQRKPRFPCDVPKEAGSGQALLEFIVDERGLVQLPAIVEATYDAFGYAAVQAVSSWRFRPPTINGKPTSIKVRIPFGFRR